MEKIGQIHITSTQKLVPFNSTNLKNRFPYKSFSPVSKLFATQAI